MPSPLIVFADQPPPPLRMVGEEVRILASGEQTGSYEIFHQAGPEGSGPPPHHHPWDEAFYILEGELHVGVDAQQDIVAKPGTLVHVAAGSMHWFRFGPGGGAMVSVTSRSGASAFFKEAAEKISPTEPDFGALVAIATSHGRTVAPPPA